MLFLTFLKIGAVLYGGGYTLLAFVQRDFVERLGIEKVRQVLLDDSEGISGRLDAEIERAYEAYKDPWLEGSSPVHPLQFAESVTAGGAS